MKFNVKVSEVTPEAIEELNEWGINLINSYKKKRFTKEQVINTGRLKKEFIEKNWDSL